MTPEQWTIVRNLYEAALDLSPEQRNGFIESASVQAEIRHEVHNLLESSQRDGFLSGPALNSARSLIGDAARRQSTSSGNLVDFTGLSLIGALVGDRYRLGRLLGRGAHGVVFLASDQRLAERQVVVKVLDCAGEHQIWLQRRFQQEIQILGTITHPGVVGIHDCGEVEGKPYLVMDFIDGITLRERMKSGILPSETAAIVVQIGAALRRAHLHGIAHRDHKPENIMVEQSADTGLRVKLIDFGIAQMHRAESSGTTTIFMVAGTTRYMAPEQFLGIAHAPSDIYAFAVVCFEILTSKTPFASSDPLNLLAEQRAASPERLLARNDRVPFYVKPLLASALALSSEARPSDAEVFGNALSVALLRQEPGRAARMRIRLLRNRRIRRVAASLLAFTLATLLAFVAWFEIASRVPTVYFASGLDDPVREGFFTHNDVRGTVELMSDGSGLEGWSLFTPSQGFYVRPLSSRQKRSAMQRGWKLSGSARLLQGGLYFGADFIGAGPRFATGATLDRGALTLRAWTDQTTPGFKSLTALIPGDPKAFHFYELVFDPHRSALALRVDRVERIHEYVGLRQFQDDFGVAFGAQRWNSGTARAIFRSVRFEIFP